MPQPPTGYRKPAPTPQPLPEERGGEARLSYPLGAWVGGKFVFVSPEAEKQWQADSFRQGSHHLLWMKGRRLRPEESALANMGLPPSDDVYPGPDGQLYQTTANSREDPQMARLRATHLAAEPPQGSAAEMGRRASEKALPQAMAMMAQGARVEVQPPAANDNRAAANDNPAPAAAKTYPGIGRFAAMAQANTDEAHKVPTLGEIAQDADDLVRLTANTLTVENTDKIAAAGSALGSLLTDETYGDAYRRNLANEQQKTAEARKRQGWAGVAAEVGPTFIPGYGDALGVAGDLKMYREHPEERTWKNYALTALGALPIIPPVASTIKKVDHALDAVEDGAKAVAKEGAGVAKSAAENVPATTFSKNYPKTYYDANPHNRGKGVVHRAIERQVLDRYPGLFDEAEIYALENLRGIPKELNNELHLKFIRREMDKFYDMYPIATREQVFGKRDEIDRLIGHLYLPTGKNK